MFKAQGIAQLVKHMVVTGLTLTLTLGEPPVRELFAVVRQHFDYFDGTRLVQCLRNALALVAVLYF